MPEYTVTFARSARKELEQLDSKMAARVLAKIETFVQHPRPHGCTKLTGSDDLWRVRIGDYRVIYSIDDEQLRVDVLAVRHRREAYQ